jgi:hypothetical protein
MQEYFAQQLLTRDSSTLQCLPSLKRFLFDHLIQFFPFAEPRAQKVNILNLIKLCGRRLCCRFEG